MIRENKYFNRQDAYGNILYKGGLSKFKLFKLWWTINISTIRDKRFGRSWKKRWNYR